MILAAGEGSRMGPLADGVPKAFIDLEGRTLYDRQRDVLDGHVDAVTVALGYGAENVLDDIGDADPVLVEKWDEHDNAETLRRALDDVRDDDVLVLNGDVLVTDAAVTRLLTRYRTTPDGRNVVACIPGHQEESTAIRHDDQGIVTDYGMIRGHRHAGMGIIDGSNVEAARQYLAHRRDEWYPVVYPAFETERVGIQSSQHVEINRPHDIVAARRKLPFGTVDEVDAQS